MTQRLILALLLILPAQAGDPVEIVLKAEVVRLPPPPTEDVNPKADWELAAPWQWCTCVCENGAARLRVDPLVK